MPARKEWQALAQHVQLEPVPDFLVPQGCPIELSVGMLVLPDHGQWPRDPDAACPEARRFAQGRGLTGEACRMSVLGEAAELISISIWGDETLIQAAEAELAGSYLSPTALVGLSAAQYADRESWNAYAGTYDWRPRAADATRCCDWLWARTLSGQPVLVPADAVLLGRCEPGNEDAIAIADSNGAASGVSWAAAQLSAILELVERDALARWWYGRRARASVDLAAVVEADRDAASLVSWLQGRSRKTWLVDITTDLGIPALVALSAEADGSDVALGHAAAVSQDRTAVSALTELVQMEVSLNAARSWPQGSWAWRAWRAQVTMAWAPLSLIAESGGMPQAPVVLAPDDEAAALAYCLSVCREAGLRVALLDRTRPELAIPVAQAVSPDLCHFKPRFARRRLLVSDANDLGPVAIEPNPVPLLV